MKLGERDEAIAAYSYALKIAEKIFKPDSEQITAVNQKLAEQNA